MHLGPSPLKHPLSTAAAISVVVCAANGTALARDARWINPAGGFWSSAAPPGEPSNWETGEAPGEDDVALFKLGSRPPGYEVTLNASPTTRGLKVTDDHVILNLNGARYTLTDLELPLVVAPEAPGDFASLTLMFSGRVDAASSVEIAGGGIGALSVKAGAVLNVGAEDTEAGIALHPNAVLDIDGGHVFTPHLFDLGGMVNLVQGTLQITKGSVFLQPDDPFGGTLTIGNDTQVGIGGALEIAPDAAVFLAGGVLTSESVNQKGALVATAGTIAANSIILRAGSTTDLFADTTADFTGGTLEIKTNATINANGNVLTDTFTNGGRYTTIQGQLNTTGPTTNTPIATLTAITSTLNFPGDGEPNSVGLFNLGKLTLAGTTINGDVHNTLGSHIDVASGVVFNGLVSGPAAFPGAGIVTFNGGYDPGAGPLFTRFDGPIALGPSNTLFVDIVHPPASPDSASSHPAPPPPPPVPGVDFDQILIASTEKIDLDGRLQIRFVTTDGSVPPLGAVYPVLRYTKRTNSGFNTVAGGLINTGFAFAPIFADLDGDLTDDALVLRASVPGDLNLDDMVSVADLSELALHFNTTTGPGSWQLGDFTSDGMVTVADLSLLALNFGFTLKPDGLATLATPLTVEQAAAMAGIDLALLPEPAGLTILLLAATRYGNTRRRDPR